MNSTDIGVETGEIFQSIQVEEGAVIPAEGLLRTTRAVGHFQDSMMTIEVCGDQEGPAQMTTNGSTMTLVM